MVSARYALHSDAADQKSYCNSREKPWSRPFRSKVNCDPGAVASAAVAFVAAPPAKPSYSPARFHPASKLSRRKPTEAMLRP
jgi:hypothetical protein